MSYISNTNNHIMNYLNGEYDDLMKQKLEFDDLNFKQIEETKIIETTLGNIVLHISPY
tara:strand:- start:11 stop:184 length:174 start_codon:yes stop_codon:yes gene_type:complete